MALLLTTSKSAEAQNVSVLRGWSLELDNDYFVFARSPEARSDDNYTHGIQYSSTDEARGWLRRSRLCADAVMCALKMSVGQWMFTPTNEAENPLPGERPHAGFLFVAVETSRIDKSNSMSLGATVGVTGPPSLAEEVQRRLHRAFPEFREPVGWEHQLPTEVAFGVSAAYRRAQFVGRRDRLGAQAVFAAKADIGTIRADLSVAADLQAGVGLHHPWVAGLGHRASLYFFARLQHEVVWQSLFLDGSTFRSSGSVARVPLVRALENGFGVRIAKLALEYSVTNQSQEYRTGPSSHSFGRLAARWANYY